MAQLDVVRHELASRIAALHARAPRARQRELVAAVDELRGLAVAAGLAPAVTVLRLIRDAVAQGERAPGLRARLAVLTDAVHADRQDAATCAAVAAACLVRLAA